MATWGSTRRGCLGINAKRHWLPPVDRNRALTPILDRGVLPDVVEGRLDRFLQPGVIQIAQHVQRVAGRALEHEYRVVEAAAVEARRGAAVVHQPAALEGAAGEFVAVELYVAVLEMLVVMFHGISLSSQKSGSDPDF